MAQAFEQEIARLYEAREQESGEAFATFYFSPKGTEVIKVTLRALPNFDQVPGPARRCYIAVLCRRSSGDDII
jgi:hypothetical protein